jgi:ABC-type nitrate/sulfonate/bicarbonate transport system substrate-binding protein
MQFGRMTSITGAALVAAMALAACGSSSSTGSASPATLGPITVSVVVPQTSIEMAPFRAALDSLQTQGITIQLIQEASISTAEQTFVANHADLLFGSTEGMLNANAQGSDGVAIWEGYGDVWVLISKASLSDPTALNGKPLATGPSGQTTYTLLVEGAKKLNFSPKLVVINGSGNRVQALVQGQVDASLASVSDFVAQDSKAPGQYKILVSYQDVFPGFSDGYIWAHQAFLTAHPAVAQAIDNAFAAAYKRVNSDKTWYLQKVATYYPTVDQTAAGKTWDQFAKLKLWPQDGDLTSAACTSRAQFLMDAGYIKSIPTVSTWCDFTLGQKAVAAANK